jgi:hypothetical protein
MGRDDDSVTVPNSVIVGERFGVHHIQTGAPECSCIDGVNKSFRINQAAPRDVHQNGMVGHQGKLAGRNDVSGFVGGRGGNHDNVCA